MAPQDTPHGARTEDHTRPAAAGRALESALGRPRGPVHISGPRHAPRARGVAHLSPPLLRAGDGHRLRQPVHRAAGGGVRGGGHEPPDFFFNDTATAEIYTLSLHA